MKIVVIAFFLIVISGLDKILTKRQLNKVEESSDIQEETIDQEILQMWRIIYIIIYVILIIVIGFLTEFKMGFTTEPDYVSINCARGDERITPVGDLREMFYKQAESDTNGWLWGGFFVLMGILGLIFKISIFGVRLPVNPVGDIQYVINFIVIVVGLLFIFRVPIYDYFGWTIDVGYSYSDLMKLIDN